MRKKVGEVRREVAGDREGQAHPPDGGHDGPDAAQQAAARDLAKWIADRVCSL
jgi:hypothetical protein